MFTLNWMDTWELISNIDIQKIHQFPIADFQSFFAPWLRDYLQNVSKLCNIHFSNN